MFGGPPPQEPTKAELEESEIAAQQTVQMVVVGSFLLYLSPFAIDYFKRLL